MNLDEYRTFLRNGELPSGLSPPLEALWHDGRGSWETAHERVQSDNGTDAAWVHAYLHRKEGDLGNADYWYRRAGRTRPEAGLEEEWESIVVSLLDQL